MSNRKGNKKNQKSSTAKAEKKVEQKKSNRIDQFKIDNEIQMNRIAETKKIEQEFCNNISLDQNDYEDISDLFSKAANDLSNGQIIHGKDYSMDVSMNATELLDSRTDPGLDSHKVKFVEEMVRDGQLADTNTLSLEDQISLMDAILPLEMAHLNGFDITQTIYTCYYFHEDAKYAKGLYIEPYFKAILRSNASICYLVDISGISLDEDFMSFDFFLPILKNTPNSEVFTLLLNAKQDLEKKISENDSNKELYEALHARIMLRHVWLSLNEKGTKFTEEGFKDMKKQIKSAKYYINIIRQSMKNEKIKGKCPEHCIQPNFSRIVPGFSRTYRPIPFLSVEASLDFFEGIFNELNEVFSISYDIGFFDLLDWLIRWSFKTPNIISRAYFINSFCLREDTFFFRDRVLFVTNSYDYLQTPTSITTHPSFKKNNLTMLFTQLIENLIRTLSCNINRCRNKLRFVMNDWNFILGQLSEMEKQMQVKARYMSLYCQLVINRVVIHHLQLGFVLDLYETYEFDDVYSVLADFYERSFKFESHVENNLRKKKNKNVRNDNVSLRLNMLNVHAHFCRAMVSHLRALTKEYSLPVVKEFPGLKRDTIFFKRFLLIYNLVNVPPINYASIGDEREKTHLVPHLTQYQQNVSIAYKDLNTLIASTVKTCPDSKKDDYVPELQSLLKCCVANNLNVQRKINEKSKPTNNPSRTSISATFPTNKLYPVLNVITW